MSFFISACKRITRSIPLVVIIAVIGLIVSANPTFAKKLKHPRPVVTLINLPTSVYKTPVFGHEAVDAWVCWLFVQSDVGQSLKPIGLTVTLFSGKDVVKSTSYSGEGASALTLDTSQMDLRLPDGRAPEQPVYWPMAVRLRNAEPTSLDVDSMKVVVTLQADKGTQLKAEKTVPVLVYHQKNKLVFPFVGKGIILQAGVTNGGHKNRSGQFALDALGLDDNWSVVLGEGKNNSDYRGWGRKIVSPGDGTVVRARNDRPNQPVPDISDAKYYAPEHPNGGDVGNYVTIDHGNGEFSMIAHFQPGSVLVKVGQHVVQGQPLGRLGSSGDATGPHVHYQLQDAPDWEYADALPVRFENVSEQFLVRGTYFEAK
ncbi:MAG: M23 family metallopeptidase [Luteimonas sp.]